MPAPRRVVKLVAILAAALLGLPRAGRGERVTRDRDFSTVGRIVTRVVEGRTVVVIPVAGPVHVRLSEPFRVSNHWRLYVTVENARLSIRGHENKRPDGLLGLSVEEAGNDVRLAMDMRTLGDYAARPSEEGYLVWIDSEPRPVLPSAMPVEAQPVAMSSQAEPVPTPAPDRGWAGGLFLSVLAMVAGLAVRHVRRNGLPERVADVADQAVLRVLKVFGFPRGSSTTAGTQESVDRSRPHSERDPRGRSADIGDAFRLEPDVPPSGIAALATTQGTDDT